MANKFGGPWTIIKLDLLKGYLNAYANVFKNQDYYNLIYLDAFAGSGKCDTNIGVIDGSTRIALENNRFNEYIFIESDVNNIKNLEALRKEFPDKKIYIINDDCNNAIPKIIKKYNWKSNRALAFLDPYNMQLSFNTLVQISSTKAFDIWYLFPLNAVTRALRNDGNITNESEKKLNSILGSTTWRNKLYDEDPQLSLFPDDNNFIRKEQNDICCFFREEMKKIFPSVLCPVCLKNSNNSPLFLLFFAVSNDRKTAQKAANNIASYLINKERTYVCNTPKKIV